MGSNDFKLPHMQTWEVVTSLEIVWYKHRAGYDSSENTEGFKTVVIILSRHQIQIYILIRGERRDNSGRWMPRQADMTRMWWSLNGVGQPFS